MLAWIQCVAVIWHGVTEVHPQPGKLAMQIPCVNDSAAQRVMFVIGCRPTFADGVNGVHVICVYPVPPKSWCLLALNTCVLTCACVLGLLVSGFDARLRVPLSGTVVVFLEFHFLF